LYLEQFEAKCKEQEEHKRKEDEKRIARKIKKINEEREALKSQRNQRKEEFSREWKISQMKEYGADKKDGSGQVEVYERRWVVGETI
jgi:hypothetical protein